MTPKRPSRPHLPLSKRSRSRPQAAQRRDGIANILSPGDLVDLDAEIRNAKIAIEFSTLQFERYKATPTLPRLTVENSERQLKTDRSQLERLKARLAHTWGEAGPLIDDTRRHDLIEALAAGTKALVRLDFAGDFEGDPHNVELRPLGTKTPIKVDTVWQAPSGTQAMPAHRTSHSSPRVPASARATAPSSPPKPHP